MFVKMNDNDIRWVENVSKDEEFLRYLRHNIARLTDEDRLKFWSKLQQGYCKSCGRKLSEQERCFCECND